MTDANERFRKAIEAREKIVPLRERLRALESLKDTHPYNSHPFDWKSQLMVKEWTEDKEWVQKQIDELQKIVDAKEPVSEELPEPELEPEPAPAALGDVSGIHETSAKAVPVVPAPRSGSSFDPTIQDRLLLEPTLEDRQRAERTERAETERAETPTAAGIWAQKFEGMSDEEWAANQERVRTDPNATPLSMRKWGLSPLTDIAEIEAARTREGLNPMRKIKPVEFEPVRWDKSKTRH